MGHYAAVWDHAAALEVTKDWNGIEQVVLRNHQGASARVRFCKLSLTLVRSNDLMILNAYVRSLIKGIIFEILDQLHSH